jgi:hypothetical protein
MKTRLIFLVLLIVSFSCGTNNKPVSDAQKEKIKGEVKEVVNTFFKGGEEVNFDMAIEPFLDSPDFVYIYNGSTLSYKDCVDAFKPLFSTQINQKFTIVDEKYAFLDNSTVLYSTNFKGISNFKDGHSSLADPVAMLLILKKIDNKWKIIYGVESSVEKNVPSETSKGLNQVELMKQMIGSWKGDVAKDTTLFWDVKSYGTGLECYYKYVNRGKIVSEGKQLWGYDKRVDKNIGTQMTKGEDIVLWAVWFISKNKYEMLSYSDISNPEKASWKMEGEFKSPDMFVETYIVNNKPVKTDTWTQVK